MRRLYLSVVALVACLLPSCAFLQGPAPDPGRAVLSLYAEPAGFDVMEFRAGDLKASSVKVFVQGTEAGLKFSATNCKPYLNAVECDIPDLNPGATYALYFRNAREAEAFYRRPDGTLYNLRASK